MAKRNQQFQTIRTEGAILPPDILQRIASLKVDGTTAESYHLPPGTKPKEAITRSWTTLLSHWRAFQEARDNIPEDDISGTGVTNERWLLPLFKELDFGRLLTEKSPEIEGRTYPIERFYSHTPIHLIGCKLPLDRRTKGARGAATSSPHSMVQEFLNRSDDHLWAFVSNGLQLRVLRDNVSLSRQAYVEFDLEAMMEGEVYSDFAILWLLCHQSRVEADKSEQCWLEKWSKLAREQGTRVLKDLRIGVGKAIEALGRGFIGHPRNDKLREKLRTGVLGKDEYYRQLLRIVYRLLFLFVAEDRELLHPPGSDEAACTLYDQHYSTRRLRELAHKIRGSKHADLWHSLSLVFDALSKESGCGQLGLCGLGSFLWRADSTNELLGPCQISDSETIESVLITNDDLLRAVRALAWVEQDRVTRTVDYRNLGSEELGSVYESLLELNPTIDVVGKSFDLLTVSGNERKLTGSYYTPDSLVQVLLDTALEPVIQERLARKKGPEAEEALLGTTVCDPACGSGHFLIAAAHRLARHLARIRTGESEPSPDEYQHALRAVISRCLYGVDVNPMAIELCKVSLWVEAIDPGKPLSFLDHHIQCGNSLVGATPRLLSEGIPDAAFEAVEGDTKTVCTSLKQQNRKEVQDFQSGQGYLFAPVLKLGILPATLAEINHASDETIGDVAAKQKRYEAAVKGADYQNARLLADTWCAVFFWLKDRTDLGNQCPTERLFRATENSPHSVTPQVRSEVQRLAKEYQFFHWHLAFPDVFRLPESDDTLENEHTGWNGGFSVVLGNPPWDKLTPDTKEFFSQFNPEVRFAGRANERELVTKLLEDDSIRSKWECHRRERFSIVKFVRDSGVYSLFAPGNLGKGDLNSYRMFVELALRTTMHRGMSAQFVPEGFYNGANCMAIRRQLFDSFVVKAILGFENAREIWFAGIDSRAKFCIYIARKEGSTGRFVAAFNIRTVEQLGAIVDGEYLNVPVSMVEEFSPDDLSLLEFRNQLDIDIAQTMYESCPKLGDESAGEPIHSQSREIDMTNDASLFSEDNGFPLYEGRMVGMYDYCAKGYVSGRARAAVWEDLPFGSAEKRIQPQWRIPSDDVPSKNRLQCQKARIGFCDVASPTNERSFVAALLPPHSIAGNTVKTIMYPDDFAWMYIPWLAVANSATMDFLVRMKVSLHLTFTLLKGLPFPRFDAPNDIVRDLAPFVLGLSCTGPELFDYWKSMHTLGVIDDVPHSDGQMGIHEPATRLVYRAIIDAIVAQHIFGLEREHIEYIYGTFPIVQERETNVYGEYRSKELCLLAFERLAQGKSATYVLDELSQRKVEVRIGDA